MSGQTVSLRPVLIFVTRNNYSKALNFVRPEECVIADRWPVRARRTVEAVNLEWLKRGSR